MTTRKRMRSVGIHASRRRKLRAKDPERVSATRKSDDGRFVKVSWCDGMAYIFDSRFLRIEAVEQIQVAGLDEVDAETTAPD